MRDVGMSCQDARQAASSAPDWIPAGAFCRFCRQFWSMLLMLKMPGAQ